MKKIVFVLVGALCVTACTSREQDEKIHAFWAQQGMEVYMWLMPRMAAYQMRRQMGNPADMENFNKAMEQWQKNAGAFTPDSMDAAPEPGEDTAQPARSRVQAPGVVSITLEDGAITGPASDEDKANMQVYLNIISESNAAELDSLKQMFPQQVWKEGVAIVSRSENNLKAAANQSATYADFMAKAMELQAEQRKAMDRLVKQNRGKIKPVK